MGGYGSGRRWDSRGTTADYRKLDGSICSLGSVHPGGGDNIFSKFGKPDRRVVAFLFPRNGNFEFSRRGLPP